MKEGDDGERHVRQAYAQAAGIAALAQSPHRPGDGIDQPLVVVADIEAQPALAEEVRRRIGRAETGELQDPLIDGGERDEGVRDRLAIAIGQLERQLDGLPRPDRLGRGQGDIERSRRRIARKPSEADGAHRQVVTVSHGRPVDARDDVGAGAPGSSHRQIDGDAFLRHTDGAAVEDAVGRDGDQGFAGKRWFDPHPRGLARPVSGLVRTDGELVRRVVGHGRALPADREPHR